MADDEVPIYRYTITGADGAETTADAISYVEDGPWMIFNDHLGTVLAIRTTAVAAVARGPEVASAHVETL